MEILDSVVRVVDESAALQKLPAQDDLIRSRARECYRRRAGVVNEAGFRKIEGDFVIGLNRVAVNAQNPDVLDNRYPSVRHFERVPYQWISRQHGRAWVKIDDPHASTPDAP